MRTLTRLCLAVLLATALAVPLTATAPAPAQREVRLAGPAPVVLEQLGRLYGVLVRVDAELSPRPLRLRLGPADLASALRVATLATGAFWVEQADGAVLVAADTPENRARYLPQELKTLVLPGRTPEELAEAVRLLREVLDMPRLYPEPRSNTVTVRDTRPRLAVAEQLLEQLKAAPGEVWLDVRLVEVDRERARELGFVPPDSVVLQHLGAGALEPTDAASLRESLEFLSERGLLAPTGESPPFILLGGAATTYAAVLPGTELKLDALARVTRSTRTLNLRARQGEEASLFVGEEFPLILATFSSSFISPVEQELRDQGEFVPPVPAVRYEKLGLQLKVRPRVHSAGEISLELKLDQKTLTGQQINGIPILSNRQLEQQVRLRNGETLLLGGLRSQSREAATTTSPLLGALPLIGRLFRRESTARTTELLVLVTPRLLRLPAAERFAPRTFYVGTESEFAPASLGPKEPAQPVQPAQPPIEKQPPSPQPPPPQPEPKN